MVFSSFHQFNSRTLLPFKNKFPYISIIDEASNFKCGVQLEFAKAHHQIPPEEKVSVAVVLGTSPKFGGCFLNFCNG